MKKHTILEGMGIEFGPGNKVVAVHEFQNTGLKNLGMQDKKIPFSELPPQRKEEVKRIVNYINKHNLAKKVTGKEDYSSLDLTFKGDGSAIISFDDGSGKVRVPKAASIVTEATSMDDPDAHTRSAAPHLGVEFGPPDPENGDKYGVKSVWTYSTMTSDKKRILNYDELEPKYRKAIQQARAYLKKAGLLPKMTAKTSWNSIDVAFTGNGEALVSTDDGSVKGERIKYAASVYTEDVNYFPY